MADKSNGYIGKATPLEAGTPVEMPAALGATFAERAGRSSKAVTADEDATEDKAVKSAATKKRARKKS